MPTPVKYDAHGTWESNNYHGLGWLGKHGYKATDEELREAGMTAEPQLLLWPTPMANDHNKRGNFNADEPRNGLPGAVRKRVGQEPWPTPMSNGLRGGSGAPKDLEQRIRTYPTPTSSDGERGSGWQGRGVVQTASGMPVAQGDGRTHQMGLRAVTAWQHDGEGELNPYWVEWLMGWPIGWTSLDPLPMENWLAWWFAQDGGVGRAIWWVTDPSTIDPVNFPDKHVPRTVHKDLPNRVERIAALGNGQVSATAAAAWIHLYELELPEST